MPVAGPESLDVRWREAADHDTVIERVGEEIDRIEGEGYETPRVLVATTHRTVRDRLRQATGLGAWEQRSEHSIVCETVHRVKGLEFDFVVLVADDDITDLLLYVGLSRALLGCSLVAPAPVAARLGLT
jgi:DNA helicase IV